MSEWTNEPPTEPGFYWMRFDDTIEIARLREGGAWEMLNSFLDSAPGNAQFWPQRIEPPGG